MLPVKPGTTASFYRKQVNKIMKIFKNIISHIDEYIGWFFLCTVVLLTTLNVIMRYVFGAIIVPVEELVLIAFTWTCYIGATTSYRQNSHVAIDVIFNILPKKVQKVLDVIVELLIFAICAYMTYLGIVMCMNIGAKTTSIMRLPYIVLDAAIVVSFFLTTIYSTKNVYLKIKAVFEKAE